VNDHSQEAKETQEVQRILEWATASTAPPEPGMDPQTAALREAWIAWGRLLETAETPMEPSWIRPAAPRRTVRRWLPLGVGVAAATLAIAAATVWFALAMRRNRAPLPEPEVADVVVQPSRLPQKAGGTPAPQGIADSKRGPSQSTSAKAEIAWEDTFDHEITQVGEQLIGLEQNWRAGAGTLDLVWSRLGQIQEEVETGKL
jgi:hypothetical protein